MFPSVVDKVANAGKNNKVGAVFEGSCVFETVAQAARLRLFRHVETISTSPEMKSVPDSGSRKE